MIGGKLDTAKLFNGITLHAAVDTPPGADAATERSDPESYVLDLKLKARLPSPNATMEELAKVSPQLPSLIPGSGSNDRSSIRVACFSPIFMQPRRKR